MTIPISLELSSCKESDENGKNHSKRSSSSSSNSDSSAQNKKRRLSDDEMSEESDRFTGCSGSTLRSEGSGHFVSDGCEGKYLPSPEPEKDEQFEKKGQCEANGHSSSNGCEGKVGLTKGDDQPEGSGNLEKKKVQQSEEIEVSEVNGQSAENSEMERNGVSQKNGDSKNDGELQKNGDTQKNIELQENGELQKNGGPEKNGEPQKNGESVKNGESQKNGELSKNGELQKNGEPNCNEKHRPNHLSDSHKTTDLIEQLRASRESLEAALSPDWRKHHPPSIDPLWLSSHERTVAEYYVAFCFMCNDFADEEKKSKTDVWRELEYNAQLESDVVMLAIAAVTEASQKSVSLLTPGMLEMAKKSYDVELRVVRPRSMLYIPWVYNKAESEQASLKVDDRTLHALARESDASAHTFLVVVAADAAEIIPQVFFVDSNRASVQNDPIVWDEVKTQIRKCIVNLDWLHFPAIQASGPTEPVGGIFADVYLPAAQQTDGVSCGIHTVLNAWACAMDLTMRTDFVASTIFYEQAIDLIYLVIRGYANAVLIWLFFSSWRYIDPKCDYKRLYKFDTLHKLHGLQNLEGLHQHVCKLREQENSIVNRTLYKLQMRTLGIDTTSIPDHPGANKYWNNTPRELQNPITTPPPELPFLREPETDFEALCIKRTTLMELVDDDSLTLDEDQAEHLGAFWKDLVAEEPSYIQDFDIPLCYSIVNFQRHYLRLYAREVKWEVLSQDEVRKRFLLAMDDFTHEAWGDCPA